MRAPLDSNLRRLPWLGGRDLQKDLGVSLHLGEDRIDFKALELEGFPLLSSTGGHRAISVAEWPDKGYPKHQVAAQQYETFVKWSSSSGGGNGDSGEVHDLAYFADADVSHENLVAGKNKG